MVIEKNKVNWNFDSEYSITSEERDNESLQKNSQLLDRYFHMKFQLTKICCQKIDLHSFY